VNRNPGRKAKVLMGGGYPAFIKASQRTEWAKGVITQFD